jgi:CTP synthase
LAAAGELKTKPTQHSVKTLMESGIQADILVCRTEHPLNDDIKRKVALFCNVTKDAVIEALDADTIYGVPLEMMREKLDKICLTKLQLPISKEPEMVKWKEFLNKLRYPKSKITVGLIGKYVELQDAYKSILEALIHAGAVNECKVVIKNIHSEFLTPENAVEKLQDVDAILVAPGFGSRGIEGKIHAIQYAREQKVPFFGICLGRSQILPLGIIYTLQFLMRWAQPNHKNLLVSHPNQLFLHRRQIVLHRLEHLEL